LEEFLRRFVFASAGVFLAFLLLKAAPLVFLVFDTKVAQPGHLPDGWRVKVIRGTPEANVVADAQGRALRLKSRSSSYSLERGVDVDPAQFPYLTWNWKVTDLPRGGDLRSSSTDDQAAQLIVAFNDRRILDYIWDSTAPKDIVQSASPLPFVHVFAFVCRSGPADLNRWITETRNVSDDFQRVFGHRPAQHIKGVRIQINSQHTGTSAESYFGDVAFRNTP
jgi:hypothetical protein